MSSLADPVGPSAASAGEGSKGGIGSCEHPALLPSPAKALVPTGFGAVLSSGVRAEQVKAAGFFFFFSLNRSEMQLQRVRPI